jgi:hypothetical protein
MTPDHSQEPVLAYRRSVSPFVEEIGPGFVVLRLPPPPVRIEVGRLLALLLAAGALGVALLVAWYTRAATGRGGSDGRALGGRMGELTILVLFTVVMIAVAIALTSQVRELIRRLRTPAGGESFALRGAGAANHAPDGPRVAGVEPGFDCGRIWIDGRTFLRVRTTDGQTLQFLRGHRLDAIEKLAADLRVALLETSPEDADDDPAVAAPRRKWNPR